MGDTSSGSQSIGFTGSGFSMSGGSPLDRFNANMGATTIELTSPAVAAGAVSGGEAGQEAPARPTRGFAGPAYDSLPDEVTTDIDCTKLVQDLKRSGIEVRILPSFRPSIVYISFFSLPFSFHAMFGDLTIFLPLSNSKYTPRWTQATYPRPHPAPSTSQPSKSPCSTNPSSPWSPVYTHAHPSYPPPHPPAPSPHQRPHTTSYSTSASLAEVLYGWKGSGISSGII